MVKYTAKVRLKGEKKWVLHKGVVGDGLADAGIRYFAYEDGSLYHFPIDAEVMFDPDRQRSIAEKMSKEAGQPIQRA